MDVLEEEKSAVLPNTNSISLVKSNKQNLYVAVNNTKDDDTDTEDTDSDGIIFGDLNNDSMKREYQKIDKIIVEKEKEFEKYSKCQYGSKCFHCVWKFKIVFFMIVFWLCGMGISQIVTDSKKSRRIAFYTNYFTMIIFIIFISKLITFIIMKILRKCTKNSWNAFYIKKIQNRLYLTILSILCLIAIYAFEEGVDYVVNIGMLELMWCIAITSIAFLSTYLFVRYTALTSYLDSFEQQTKKYKACSTFIQIMLNQKSSLFNMPIMNFLVDFPSNEHLVAAEKNYKDTASFKFNIKKQEILKDEKSNKEDVDLYSVDLYSFSLNQKGVVVDSTVIDDKTLRNISEKIASLIIKRLNIRKKEILQMPKYADLLNNDDTKKSSKLSGIREKFNLMKTKNFSPDPLKIEESMNYNKINEDMFILIFQEYDQKMNKQLLKEFGELAWTKCTNCTNNTYLNEKVLKTSIFNMMQKIFILKKSIDSYISIIHTLQKTMDVLTPVVLLFVYLFIWSFDFAETVTLYVSSVAIVGFFGASYFGAVLDGITLIIAMNPFFVGDYIMYENIVYRVDEISLISSTFTQMKNRYQYIFQNKQLAQSSLPIINFSRCGKQKYKWKLYFKPTDINDITIYQFVEKIKEKIKQRIEYHSKQENIKKSFCEKSELDDIEWWTIKAKSYELDDFGRKEVKVQMKYNQYCSDVQTLCFNCICAAIKELKYDCDPLKLSLKTA